MGWVASNSACICLGRNDMISFLSLPPSPAPPLISCSFLCPSAPHPHPPPRLSQERGISREERDPGPHSCTLALVHPAYNRYLRAGSFSHEDSGVVCSCMHACLVASVVSNFCNPMDRSLPGCSVHGILQAGILECVAMPSSRGSSWPRDQICISHGSCIAGRLACIAGLVFKYQTPTEDRWPGPDLFQLTAPGSPCT